jgi:hypothetical protein
MMSDSFVGTAILVAIGILLFLPTEELENLSPVPATPVVVEPVIEPVVIDEPEEEAESPEPPPKKALPEGLKLLNVQREQRGLGPLVLDPALQAGAEVKASMAASRRIRGHLGGSLYGASKEGIGYGSSRTFRACYAYTAPAGTPVGAAIRQGADGYWYCCLLVRYSGYLPSKPGVSSRFRRRIFR